jgi:hypothetical protein
MDWVFAGPVSGFFPYFNILTILSVPFLLVISIRRVWGKRYLELPGPKQLPFIGRVHDLPLECTWLKLKEWADQYGPIYRTNIVGFTFVVVSNEAIVEELLVKRAKIHSDRPRMPSVIDSKSTNGSMEYLPLMGNNST